MKNTERLVEAYVSYIIGEFLKLNPGHKAFVILQLSEIIDQEHDWRCPPYSTTASTDPPVGANLVFAPSN